MGVGIYQRDGATAIEVSRRVMALLKEREASTPPGVEMQVITDVADTVRDNLTSPSRLCAMRCCSC